MANDWIVPPEPEKSPPKEKTAAAKTANDWIVPPEQEDVSAGMVLSGVPVLGAYIPQAEAAIRAAAQPITGVGKPGATYAERYAANLPDRQAQYKMAEESHPVASTAAKMLGGGLALAPLGAGAIGGRLLGAVGPMAARIPLGAASGGGIGVADALARGEDPYKAGAIGMVGGAVAPVAGQAIGAAAQGVRSWLPGAPSAAERLAGQMGRAGLAADDLTTPAALGARSAELGPQGTASEFGENLRGLAQGMATQPGPARQTIFERMTQRASGARERIEDGITQALGPRQDMALLTRGEQAARGVEADPLYEAFRSTTVHPTDQIRNLVPVLERDGLLAEGQRLMSLEGRPAQANFFVTGDRKTWPTTEAFDYVKQAIDGRISMAVRNGNNNLVRIYKGVKDRLDDAVANSNPEAAQIWRQARETWGNRTEILNAREAGQGAFTKGMRRDEMRETLQGMSNPERAAFREGARDALAEMMDASVRGDTNARQALLAPANREKLMMLGRNQASADLIRNMERELGFTDTLQRLIGNSQTASRQAMGAVTQPPAGGGAVRQYLQQLDLGRPASWVPTRAGFDAAQTLQTGRQAARYEDARQILADALMQQGPAGEQSLLRLLNTRAPGRVDPLASRIGTIGAQGGQQGF